VISGAFSASASATYDASYEVKLCRNAQMRAMYDSCACRSIGNVAKACTARAVKAGSSTVFTMSYGRDNGGRLSSITETANGQTTATTYVYDTAGRLSDVSVGGTLVRHYDYDASGNRLTKTDASGPVTATFDDQDHLVSFAGSTYTYTTSGELQTKVDASGTTTYSYDAFGLLRRVVLPNGNVIDYVIDGWNRRVGKKVNGTLVQGWLYSDQLRIVAETDGTGNVTKRFVHGLRPNIPDYMIWSGGTYRFVTDQLGSPRYLLEGSGGTVAESVTYDEYGSILSDSNASFQPFRFAGGLYDPDKGFVHFGAREYDPQTGRWTTRDPLGFAGGDTNLYGYVLQNPVSMTDPTGLYTGVDDAAFIVGGALIGVAAQALVNVATTGSLGDGSDYVSAAVGGAVGGEALLYTGPALAGAAGAAAANAIKQWMSDCPSSIASFAVDTAVGAATGAFFGGGLRPGITEGNGSWIHVFRTQVGRMRSGATTRVTVRTAAKMFAGRAEETAAYQGAIVGGAIGSQITKESPTCGCH
jgi:RHS repeat-associated protein